MVTGQSAVTPPLITEISLLQSGQSQAPTNCEVQMVDVYREKPIRLVVKVTVPVKEHPKVNRVNYCKLKKSCFFVFPNIS